MQKGAEKFEFLVHHPATSKLPPCHRCYGQFHLEKDCTTKDPTASRAAVSRLVQIGELRKIPFSIPINLNDLKKSLQEVRAALQPEISNRLGKEKKEKPSNRSPKSRSKATQANEAPVTKEAELMPLSQDKKRTPKKGPTLHVQITNELIEMQREDMDKTAKVKTKEDKTKDVNVGQCDRTDQAKQEENKQREPDTDELMVEARIELLIQDSAKETKAHESTTIHENATTKSKRARAFSEEHYEQDLITATSMQPPPRQARANTIQKSIVHRRTSSHGSIVVVDITELIQSSKRAAGQQLSISRFLSPTKNKTKPKSKAVVGQSYRKKEHSTNEEGKIKDREADDTSQLSLSPAADSDLYHEESHSGKDESIDMNMITDDNTADDASQPILDSMIYIRGEQDSISSLSENYSGNSDSQVSESRESSSYDSFIDIGNLAHTNKGPTNLTE